MESLSKDPEKSPPRISIVVPCFNEEDCLDETIDALIAKLAQLAQSGLILPDSSITFCDDGSSDGTWRIVEKAHQAYPSTIHGILFAANKGKEYALLAGIEEAKDRSDAVICMDADLQFDIGALEDFLTKYAEGYEVVYGIKKSRGAEPLYKKWCARMFYGIMVKLGSPMRRNLADYCLLSHRACEALLRYPESNVIFRGLLYSIGFKKTSVHFDVHDRTSGSSHFSAFKLLNLSLDAITSFSVAPLRTIVGVGFMVLLIGIIMVAWTCVDVFRGMTPSGYATIACSIWFVGGLGMLCLGIMGEYLGKLYMESKHRPRYIISKRI